MLNATPMDPRAMLNRMPSATSPRPQANWVPWMRKTMVTAMAVTRKTRMVEMLSTTTYRLVR